MFSDVIVEILQGTKPIYRASVLVPRNVEVKHNGLKKIPIKVICPPNRNINNTPTYHDGIDLAIRADEFKGNAITQLTYEISIPDGSGKMVPFGQCTRADRGHKTYDSRPSLNLKQNEVARVGDDEMQINVTLKGTYIDAPAGRIIAEFVEN